MRAAENQAVQRGAAAGFQVRFVPHGGSDHAATGGAWQEFIGSLI